MKIIIYSILIIATIYVTYLSIRYNQKETECNQKCQMKFQPQHFGEIVGVRINEGVKCVCVEKFNKKVN